MASVNEPNGVWSIGLPSDGSVAVDNTTTLPTIALTLTITASGTDIISFSPPAGSGATFISPGSGSFSDAQGNVYAIDPSGNILENGSDVFGGSNTGSMALFNGVVYGQDATSGIWYTFDPTSGTFTQASAAPPAGGGTPAEITPGSGTFSDATGNTYSIDAQGNAVENGSLIDGGSNTGAMAIVNGVVYGQDATTKDWYTWDQSTWTASAAPSIGGAFAANVQLTIVNDSGQTIDGMAVNLGDATLSNIAPTSFGGDIGFFTSDDGFGLINGNPSQIASLGTLAPGATTTGSFVVNQPSESPFSMAVTTNVPSFPAASNAPATVASGDGDWTITPSADATLAAAGGGAVGIEPALTINIDLTTLGTDTISFLAPPTPGDVDSIGFTAYTNINIVNNTGHTLSDLVLSLANTDPASLQLAPPSVHYGVALELTDPNYAFLANLGAGSFGSPSLLDPQGNATNGTTGNAASAIVVGSVAAGASVSGSLLLHNTELTTNNNSFNLNVLAS